MRASYITFSSSSIGNIMEYCYVDGFWHGVELNGASDMTVSYCRFVASNCGLRTFDFTGTLIVTYSSFIGNDHGVHVEASGSGNVSVTYCDLIDSINNNVETRSSSVFANSFANCNIHSAGSGRDFNNGASCDIDATNCWWGTTDTGVIDGIIYDKNDIGTRGLVDYSGYLSSPVLTAGCGW